MMRRPTDILGYCQPLAVHPGGTTELKISSNGPATCDIGIFRVICADIDPNGPGAEFEQQEWCAHPDVDIFHQPINAGSYALSLKTPEIDWSVPFEFTAYLWPTCVDGGLQAVLSWGGLEVGRCCANHPGLAGQSLGRCGGQDPDYPAQSFEGHAGHRALGRGGRRGRPCEARARDPGSKPF